MILTCEVLQVVSVEFTLDRGHSNGQHILVFRRQELCERGVIFPLLEAKINHFVQETAAKEVKEKLRHSLEPFVPYLYTAGQHLIQDVSSLLHDPDVV